MIRDLTPPARLYLALAGADKNMPPTCKVLERQFFKEEVARLTPAIAILSIFTAAGLAVITVGVNGSRAVASLTLGAFIIGSAAIGLYFIAKHLLRVRPRGLSVTSYHEKVGRAYLIEKMAHGEIPIELTPNEQMVAGAFLQNGGQAGQFGILDFGELQTLERLLENEAA